MMVRRWIEAPLLSSYVIGDIVVGQVVEQTTPRKTTWATFDTSGMNSEMIADGYKSIHEAKTAMQQYWDAKEPALSETPEVKAAGRTNPKE